ncbi:hypothetical protein [Actinokineospora sp. NPDC004072]
MRRLFVIACCAALTAIGGAHASAQVLPPPHTTSADSAVTVIDVWAGLKSIL